MDKKYTIKDLYKTVGEELGNRIVDVCGNGSEDRAVDLFYNYKIKPYDNMTLFELHQINPDNLEGILEIIEFGGTL